MDSLGGRLKWNGFADPSRKWNEYFQTAERWMDRFESMSAFVAVVEAGGFSTAPARRALGLAQPARFGT
jgi:hypothetical protein